MTAPDALSSAVWANVPVTATVALPVCTRTSLVDGIETVRLPDKEQTTVERDLDVIAFVVVVANDGDLGLCTSAVDHVDPTAADRDIGHERTSGVE